jgi:hypothetical protein
VCAQSKIVFVAVNSPSFAPPLVASVDIKTVGLDDTGVGHPQSAPKFDWAKPVRTEANTTDAVATIFVNVFFILSFLEFVINWMRQISMSNISFSNLKTYEMFTKVFTYYKFKIKRKYDFKKMKFEFYVRTKKYKSHRK